MEFIIAPVVLFSAIGVFLVYGLTPKRFDEKNRFTLLLNQNNIHTTDDLMGRVLSVPMGEWDWRGEKKEMEAVLFDDGNEQVKSVFYKSLNLVEIWYGDQLFLKFGFYYETNRYKGEVQANKSNLAEVESSLEDAKWNVFWTHLSSLYDRIGIEQTEEAQQAAEQKAKVREQHLLKMRESLLQVSARRFALNDKTKHPFRLDVTTFKTANLCTGTLYFEDKAFVVAEWENGRFESKWLEEGNDFEALFRTLTPEVDACLCRTLRDCITHNGAVQTEDSEVIDAFPEITVKMQQLLTEPEWLEESEKHLLSSTYPGDLKRLQQSLMQASTIPSIEAHAEEALLAVNKRLDEITSHVQKRKECRVVQAKNILIVRES